jgi:hypothetical protein
VAYTFTFLVERRRIRSNLHGNGVLYVSFEIKGENKGNGLTHAVYNSNTPLPKRYGTKCPATISGVPCAGAACLSRRKGCLYWLFRRDPVAGRHAIVQLKSEGYEVV